MEKLPDMFVKAGTRLVGDPLVMDFQARDTKHATTVSRRLGLGLFGLNYKFRFTQMSLFESFLGEYVP